MIKLSKQKEIPEHISISKFDVNTPRLSQ